MTCFYVKGVLDAFNFLKNVFMFIPLHLPHNFTAAGPTFFRSNSYFLSEDFLLSPVSV